METKVFKVDKSKAGELVNSPEVKRKGEASQHDAGALGVGKGTLVVVKGSEALFELDIFKGLDEVKDKDEVLKKLAELEESSAMGVGTIFG